MSRHLIPVMLRCEGKSCCIVGGGRVAERKAAGLLHSGATLTVISPSITDGLQVMLDNNQLRWIKRPYNEGDLQGAFLVYAATDDLEVNDAVMREARGRGILVNVADHSEKGDFITPGVVRRGRLVLSVSTSGAGPSVSVAITTKLEETFGLEYEAYLDFMYDMRERIKSRVHDPLVRARLLRRLACSGVLEQIRSGEFDGWTELEMDRWIAENREE
ncbi:bifunctional precorrin-2 dehydrogenase/sirohydrochlorin ferrochelatase [Paenibacillus sp. P96]|uniref:precorrin-2 dehydrogenase n=1 Tax=Paenibacillus zeirhizosphaerae TaxID=2987519 RepID=A0ABT9FLR9_9BACL|nr:bifunctional precorrin-2 dehydrogenase/sirohydrochlorin ferrochelatase [Paenibacillus sp. P96]MDP4095678.1 bifunctional precorrin-2 dehydrogenase/sirohydrochlorin ferrochelatase [Paenibacillus sp. P96]